MEQLREISRQHYLEKREEKELKLLEMGEFFKDYEICYCLEYESIQFTFLKQLHCVCL